MKKTPTISIIIPVLNEENYIKKLLDYLKPYQATSLLKEIIVIDGGSSDHTLKIVSEYNVKVFHSEKGRATQMNLGAKHAVGDILYFLHVDTKPPENFHFEILQAVKDDFKAGCFRMRFNSRNLFLAFFAYFSRFNHIICRGGDQSLFVTRHLFEKAGRFNEDYIIYEDTEFIGRLYKLCNFKVIPNYVTTSARKYNQVGTAKLQYYFGVIHFKRLFGAKPENLYQYYKRKITV